MKANAISIAVLCFLLSAGQALACVMLEAATPKVGSTVASGVESVSIKFSSSIFTLSSTLVVSDASGKSMNIGAAYGESDDSVLITKVNPLPPGKYKVSWSVQCNHCEKPLSGSYKFTVS